jgi:tRNA(Arg) A34 adenosine deaminase TadA
MKTLTIDLPAFNLVLPPWVSEALPDPGHAYPTPEAKMELAIGLSRLNVDRRFGGPFGAAIFDLSDNRVVAVGMNLVIPARCSVAHAEMVAIILAQQKLRTHDLQSAGDAGFELVTSTAPCAMCLGAIPWSGVRSVVCGARDEDARGIGFDEGSKPPDWVGTLRKRDISVVCDVRRDEACSVLQLYANNGGTLY